MFRQKNEIDQNEIDKIKESIRNNSILSINKLFSAGDMVPGDVRLISSRDLFVSQSAITGEALPIEKHEILKNFGNQPQFKTILKMSNLRRVPKNSVPWISPTCASWEAV